MAYVLADQRDWLKENEAPFEFNVLHNFKAMRDAVNDGSSDYFMWETFTTKPYHDSGEVKRIGQITPPWPAFMFAAHTSLLGSDEVKKTMAAIQKATDLFMAEKEDASVKHVMRILDYPEKDVRDWFKTVKYASDLRQVSRGALDVTVATLRKADVVPEPVKKPEDLIDASVAELIN
jgi:hypothetical protein